MAAASNLDFGWLETAVNDQPIDSAERASQGERSV